MVVTLEAPPAADLGPLEEIREVYRAAECFKAGTATPCQIVRLSRFNVDELQRDRYAEVMRLVRLRQLRSGTPEEFEAARRRADDTAASLENIREKNAAKIAKLKADLAKLEGEISDAKQVSTAAKDEFEARAASRRALSDVLLPDEVRAVIQQITRPVRAKYADELRAAQVELKRANIPDGSGERNVPLLQEALQRLKAVEDAMKAECEQATQQLLDFWFAEGI